MKEVTKYETNPFQADTDCDGFNDLYYDPAMSGVRTSSNEATSAPVDGEDLVLGVTSLDCGSTVKASVTAWG